MNYLSKTHFTSKYDPSVSFKLKKMSHGRRTQLNLDASKPLATIGELQRQLAPVLEEIQRSEEAAKWEPCQCTHSLDATSPAISERIGEIAKLNTDVLKRGGKPVEMVDVCHSSITKRCIVPGCSCRKPSPDPAIGGYDSYRELINKIMIIEDQELRPVYIRNMVQEIIGLEIEGQPATTDTLLSDGPEALVDEVGTEIERLIKLTPEESLGFKSPTTSDAAAVGQAELITAR